MNGRGRSAKGVGVTCRRLAILLGVVSAVLDPARSFAQTITYSEFKLGVWDHDVQFLGGREHGADINPEMIFASPVGDGAIAGAPSWLRWALQPRATTIGAAINTSRGTDQAYAGATWSWMLIDHVVTADDGVFVGYFFGPSVNDGKIGPAPADRPALGSHVLFREAAELGYRINLNLGGVWP